MSSKFDFYEVVRVSSECVRYSHLSHQEGVVLAMAQDEQSQWHYTVFINDSSMCWVLMEHELEPTGRSTCEESFYSEGSIRVKVDPITGEGSIDDASRENNP